LGQKGVFQGHCDSGYLSRTISLVFSYLLNIKSLHSLNMLYIYGMLKDLEVALLIINTGKVAMTLIGVVKALKQTLNRILSGPQLSF